MTVNEWRNEWVNDKVDEWMGQQAIVQKNERMCEWLTVLMITLWMIDWKILIVWMLYGRICQRDLVCRHSYALRESKSKKRNVLYPQKRAILGLFMKNFAVCVVFIIGYMQDTYLGEQLRDYRESH